MIEDLKVYASELEQASTDFEGKIKLANETIQSMFDEGIILKGKLKSL